jgi:DNA-binding transcriptional LysR family regulator
MLGQDWKKFCRKAGLKLPDIQEGQFHRASHYVLALEMAKRGIGVALVPDFLASRDLDTGQVVRLRDMSFPSGRTYHLCFKNSRAHEQKLMTLVHWFRSVLSSDKTHIQLGRQPARVVPHKTGRTE